MNRCRILFSDCFWYHLHFPYFQHHYSLLSSVLYITEEISLKKRRNKSKLGKQKQSVKYVRGLLQCKNNYCSTHHSKNLMHVYLDSASLMPCLSVVLMCFHGWLVIFIIHCKCTDVSLININDKLSYKCKDYGAYTCFIKLIQLKKLTGLPNMLAIDSSKSEYLKLD